MKRYFFALVASILLALFVFEPGDSLSQLLIPWSNHTQAESYIVIGQNLWNVDTNKFVGESWSPCSSARSFPRAVLNTTDYLFCEELPPEFGFAVPLAKFSKPYQKAKILIKYKDPSSSQGPFLSSDYRRVVYYENGDVWRADFDWMSGQLKNNTQVTSIGLLGSKKPLLWYGNHLYIKTNFSKEKPVARVNLSTGQIDELGTINALLPVFRKKGSNFVNPDAYRVVNPTRDVLHSFDARSGRIAQFNNRSSVSGNATTKSMQLLNLSSKFYWLDNDNAVAEGLTGVIAAINFNANSLNVYKPSDSSRKYKIRYVLPGKQYVDLVENKRISQKLTPVARWLLNPKTGQKISLSIPPEAPGKWLDDTRLMYSVTTGQLSEIGTWVYNRSTGQNTKIAQIPASRLSYVQRHDDNSARYFPRQNMVYFLGGGFVYRVRLDGTNFSKVTSFRSGHDGRIGKVDMDAINLGIGTSNTSLWQMESYNHSALIPESQPTYQESATGNEGTPQYSEEVPQDSGQNPSSINGVTQEINKSVNDINKTIKNVKDIFDGF